MKCPKTGRYKKVSYTICTLDVWGNAKEGFQVNDIFRSGELDVTASEVIYNHGTEHEFKTFVVENKKIILALKRAGYLKRNVRHSSIAIDGEKDYTLYIDDAKTSEPLFQLRFMED